MPKSSHSSWLILVNFPCPATLLPSCAISVCAVLQLDWWIEIKAHHSGLPLIVSLDTLLVYFSNVQASQPMLPAAFVFVACNVGRS